MKKLIFLLALTLTAFGADNLISPPKQRQQVFEDITGRTWPISVMYTTDGNGNAVPVGGSTATIGSVSQGAAGATPWKQDISTLFGAAPSATNYLPIRLTDGTSFTSGGLTDAQLRASPLSVIGTFFQATQPISALSLPLPTNAATDASVVAVGAKLPTAFGQQTQSTSLGVALASEQMADMNIDGQAAQTAIVQNILSPAAGNNYVDLAEYRSATVQVVSTGTAGTYIFEGSNDGVSFVTIPVFNQLIVTGTPVVAAVTATASQIIYSFPATTRFMRLRIVSNITGGSIRAFSKLSRAPWSPAVNLVANATAANLTASVSGSLSTITTVAAVTSSNAGSPGLAADVASAAITVSTTTAAITPGAGSAFRISIPVTVASGTSPTLDVSIEESPDTGTNWIKLYDFPRITTTGFYTSPELLATGNRIRYVQNVTGITPSFTRSIQRTQLNTSPTRTAQLIDRVINTETLNAVTSSLYSDGCHSASIEINLGAVTTPPTIQVEGSNDGSNWFAVGSPLLGVASSSVHNISLNSHSAKFLRARVSVAGTGVTPGFILLKGF